MYTFEHVELRSFRDISKPVARGMLMSRNPEDIVGNQELGRWFVEVHVEIPIEQDEPLVRPYGQCKTIGDAVGKPIAWPESMVRT